MHFAIQLKCFTNISLLTASLSSHVNIRITSYLMSYWKMIEATLEISEILTEQVKKISEIFSGQVKKYQRFSPSR